MSITDTPTLSTTVLSDLTINLIFDSVSSTYPDRPELQICKPVDNGNLLIDLDTDNKVSHVSIPKPPTAYGERNQHVWVPSNAPLEPGEQALLEQFDVQNIADTVLKAVVNNKNCPFCEPWCTPEHSEFAAVKSLIESCTFSIGSGDIDALAIAFQYQCADAFVEVQMTKQFFKVYVWSPNEYELNLLLTRENPLDEWILTQILPRHCITDIKKMFEDIMS